MTDKEREWVETNNAVCALLKQAHDVLALSSLAPRREWVGLTEEEFKKVCWESGGDGITGGREEALRAMEALLKEKNNG